MKSIFSRFDRWNHKLCNAEYWRGITMIFVISMIPAWFILGFDSGVGMIEEAIKAWVSGSNPVRASYNVYGMTFHFSSYIIYGLLFIGLSLHLETVGIKQSKNLAYSGILTILNIGLFEIVYMGLFATFQMGRPTPTWFIEDFFLAPIATNFSFVVIGLMALLHLWADGYTLKYRFKLDKTMICILIVCFLSVCLWVYYPFPVNHLTIGDWTSSQFFPQTHYAYMRSNVHMRNDLLHLVNVIVKAMFAVSQLYILRGYRNVES